MLAVWGQKGLFAEAMKSRNARTPLQVWQDYAENVEGVGLDCGHFVTEEDPHGLVKEVLRFFNITTV